MGGNVADRDNAAGRGLADRLWPVLRGLGADVVGRIVDAGAGRPRGFRFKASVWRRDRRQFVPVSLVAVDTVSSDGRRFLVVKMPDE